jgi:hypothetical protein
MSKLVDIEGLPTPETSSLPAPAVDPTMQKVAKSGSVGGAVAKGVARGAARGVARKAAEKGVTAALKKIGIKAIPGFGSIAAGVSALADAVIFLKDLYTFAQAVQKTAGVELTGISSLIGEYTLIDASADDLNKIAVALENSNMSQEEAKDLYSLYWNAMSAFKSFLVNLLLAFKELSGTTSFFAAIAIMVLPVETALKELLFYVHKTIKDIKAQSPAMLNFLIDAVSVVASSFLPIVGFLLDTERVVAFSKIEDAMSKISKRGSKQTALDSIEQSVAGGKVFYDLASELGDDIAAGVSNIKFENKTYSFDKFEKIYK